ncbi:hypothetical protein KFK09_024719 [Dendrobium nobile]|uniref:DUF4283 domain-containing protein n=1 Tax=Dendrobium nobile TaxID=94219 RepID=A0A8T3AEJ6_DENNO|nr:hypothetical protein KFK09_024719 [Dendrobium nobile]
MAKKLLDPGFLAGMQPKSFRDALSGDSIVSFPNFRISSHRGMPSLWFSEEEFLHLAKPFEFALVGRFPLKRPTLDSIRKFFFGLKLSGDFSVTLLDQTNVLIKLHNDLDYARVFAHRSYLVFGCFMKVIKWSLFLISLRNHRLCLFGCLSLVYALTFSLLAFCSVWVPFSVDRYKLIMPLLLDLDLLWLVF